MLAVLGLCTLVPGPACQRKPSPAWEEIWAELDVFLLSTVQDVHPDTCPVSRAGRAFPMGLSPFGTTVPTQGSGVFSCQRMDRLHQEPVGFLTTSPNVCKT